MDLIFKRYMRVLFTLVLSVLFWLSGIVCYRYDLYFTSVYFKLMSVSFLVYLLLFWIFRKKKYLAFTQTLTQWEIRIIPVIGAVICMLGIIESYPNRPDFTTAFGLLLLYVIIYIIVLITNYYRQKRGTELLSKSLINKLIFWTFVIGVGRVIILIEQYGDSDALIIVSFFYFPLLIILIARWIFKQTRAILTLKNEKAKTELMHLKSQVNPHFFFNMLNNVYGLVGKDAKKAQELILKLSDMMRYSIYDGEKETVLLSEEITYLENYIELHKMRYHKAIDVQFKFDIEDNDYEIMPLLFIILLENAFKHGVENLRKNAYVYLSLTANNNEVVFEIENNFDATEDNHEEGIGLKNLKRRLELVYPKNHTLAISKGNDVYKAKLNIKNL